MLADNGREPGITPGNGAGDNAPARPPLTGSPEAGSPGTSAPDVGTPNTGTPNTGVPNTSAPGSIDPIARAPDDRAPVDGAPDGTGQRPDTGLPQDGFGPGISTDRSPATDAGNGLSESDTAERPDGGASTGSDGALANGANPTDDDRAPEGDDAAADDTDDRSTTGEHLFDEIVPGGSPLAGGSLGGPLQGGSVGGPTPGSTTGPIGGALPPGSKGPGSGGELAGSPGSPSDPGSSSTGGGSNGNVPGGDGTGAGSGGGSGNGGGSGSGGGSDGNGGGSGSGGGSDGNGGGSGSGGGSDGNGGGSGSGGGSNGGNGPDSGSSPPGQVHPGWNNANRLLTTLPSTPWGSGLQVPANSAHVKLDDQWQLESLGVCPGVLCLARGTARVVEAGGDRYLRWGRWVDGVATLTVLGIESSRQLGARDGIHYLVGAPTVSMPTSGEASYSLTGATAATFASGAHETGTLSGNAHVHFGSGLTTKVGLDASVNFCSGASYRMQSNGGLANVDATNLRMTSGSTFAGNIAVSSGNDANNPLGCTGGNCRANIQGGFFGPGADALGFSYSIGTVSGGTTPRGIDNVPFTGDTINGVGAMHRRE